MREEVLRQLQQSVEVAVSNLGLDHPELGQMPPRLRLLRAESGPKAVHLAQRQRGRLNVKLAGLGEKRRVAEVVHRKQRRGALARRRRQNRRVGADEAVLVEVFGRRAHDLRADAQNGRLPRRPHPQMAVLHEEVDAVFLQRDRVGIALRHPLHHFDVLDVQFEAAGRALVRPDLAGDNHR